MNPDKKSDSGNVACLFDLCDQKYRKHAKCK